MQPNAAQRSKIPALARTLWIVSLVLTTLFILAPFVPGLRIGPAVGAIFVLTTAAEITRELIPDHVRSAPSFHVPHVAVPPEGINLRDVIASFERRLIESTLETTGGGQKEAARLLGLKPTTLNEMIKRYNILLPRDRDRERRPREAEETTEKPTPA
mgnify:CR=1 FL=1